MVKKRASGRSMARAATSVPADARRLGKYGGFELFLHYIAEARYSARAVAYIYATEEGREDVAFTQVSAVHRSIVEDRSAEEVERRLTVDAISRAKLRIKDDSFERGRIYTLEIRDLWEDQVGSVDLGDGPEDSQT